jgi:hypothetical protein
VNFLRKIFGPVTTHEVPSKSAQPTAPSAPDATAARPQPTPAPAPVPPPAAPAVETTLLTVPGPVWLPTDSPAAELYPAKAGDTPIIAFIGGSAELDPDLARDPSHAAGPALLSRALPLYLAEQVELSTTAMAQTLVSWVVKPRPGFIVGGKNWDDATAARHASRGESADPADYVVVCHLLCLADPWLIELRLVRTSDAACLATASASCPAADPGAALPGITRSLLTHLAKFAGIPADPTADPFATPQLPSKGISAYLMSLEQLLGIRIAALDGADSTLHHEEAILQHQLGFCLAAPGHLPARLLFANTLRALSPLRPEATDAFRERAEQLNQQHPLPEPAQSVLQRLHDETFAA